MYKGLCIFICMLIAHVALHAQADRAPRVGMLSSDSAKFDIVSTRIDSFPQISVIVRAERFTGEPMWNLDINDVQVTEDGMQCKVRSVKTISRQFPFNITLVLDHSSSKTNDVMSYYGYRNRTHNHGPLTNAKMAIQHFATSLSNNHDSLINVVSRIYADGITAFYDAVDRAIETAAKGSGIKLVVALTDGTDNNSRRSLRSVISKANQARIPVYVVALGDVDTYPLISLATQTNGQFFYARNSKDLDNVYKIIHQRLQAYYAVIYQTDNYNPNAVGRTMTITYRGDSTTVVPGSTSISLPDSVVEYLRSRRRNHILLGSGVSVLAVGVSIVLLRRRKRTEQEQAA